MSIDTKKKAMIILFIFCLGLSWWTFAQEKEIEEIKKFITKKRVNAGYFLFGGSQLIPNKLNDYLEYNDHPTIPKTYLSWGIGGHAIHDKYVVGVEIIRLMERESGGDKEFRSSASAKYTVLNLGYLLFQKKGLMYYPYAGFGVGQFSMRLTENNISSFDDIVGIQKGSDAKRLNLLMNIGFSLDYFHKYNPKKQGKNNLVLGVRAGYLFSIHRFDWRVNHIKVEDGPDACIKGFYIRVTIGLGGYIEKIVKKVI